MSLILKNKFLPEFNDGFFGNEFFPNFFDNSSQINMPAVNISENGNHFKIELAAPGLEKSDFKIEVKNNMLTISSEKEQKNEDSNDKFMRREFNYCSFKRTFGLPQSVDSDKISAEHKNGILSVIIPKREEAKEKPNREILIS